MATIVRVLYDEVGGWSIVISHRSLGIIHHPLRSRARRNTEAEAFLTQSRKDAKKRAGGIDNVCVSAC